MDRRLFLKSMAAAALLSSVPAAACACRAKVGVQLYTVRGLMAENVERTLEAIAAQGYGEVEFAGYYDRSAKDIRRMLGASGLASPSTHISLDLFENNIDAVIDFAAEVGHQYLVLPWLLPEDRTMERYRSIVDTLNIAGEKAKSAGLQVAYHNHEFEFETIDDEQPFELLLTKTDPDLVKFELDLYWLNVAGVDALDIINRYPRRVPLVHVKDRTADGNMTHVGAGTIDFDRVFAHAEKAGLKHYMVEHDNPVDALASTAASISNLKKAFPWFCA